MRIDVERLAKAFGRPPARIPVLARIDFTIEPDAPISRSRSRSTS